ncbi:purine-binding chemotaxis protein CheW [Halogeometricum borinquense]|uniref:CheW protein n=2 Tax=Halogeometricum borinquense TaxID=60847 RepID=E4NP41_HALBP|nr:chemotaxis protein CheW [Halogeometricum borinquense]ADQ67582.1 CheW protein [Halogeometricum borinquense DSM 11551]ELY23738.1 chemotaxis protein CheW [Halogeometricum borinquense DSM 11551]QIB73824.1 purine-binding chemotaxis protein CheW [Halogeometricum borinquense]QIQ76818.1 purine-binding chemotaxis protein CheW [Halogeometricum borinquense]RYJ13465.1 purine-binding chemotaxis protein CheW [Halogeometricum borinquense]
MSQEPQTAAVPNTDESDEESVREIQVLEFKLGDETYCVDIEYVSEIVDKGSLTAVPNAPDYVDGVMDLRGRTTSIVNPKALLNVDAADGESKRIVIFDSNKFEDDAAIGWLVDEVYQVVRVSMDEIEEPPLEKDDSIEGVIKRDGELVIWISPVNAVAEN